MSDSELDRVVREVASVVLGATIQTGENLKRIEAPSWDSLKHVELIFAIEDACDVRFDQDELVELDSTDAIVAGIQRHRAS